MNTKRLLIISLTLIVLLTSCQLKDPNADMPTTTPVVQTVVVAETVLVPVEVLITTTPQNTPLPSAIPTITATGTGTPLAPANTLTVGTPLTPMPGTTLAPCQPIAITNFTDRFPSYINGIKVELQVRDLNSCARNLFYAETGIDNPNTTAIEGAQNFDLKIGEHWAWIVAPTTVAVHELNGSQIDYVNQEIVVIYGPWTGGTGVYEGAVHLVPVEWVEQILSEILPIQTAQAGHEIQIVRINQ